MGVLAQQCVNSPRSPSEAGCWSSSAEHVGIRESSHVWSWNPPDRRSECPAIEWETIRLMNVREIMKTPVITVHEDCSLEEAAKTMLEHKIGCLPVVNGQGEICGIVTESDFAAKERGIPFSLYRFPQVFGNWMPKQGVERMYESARNMTVGKIMSRHVVYVKEDDSVETLLEKMLRSRFHRIPVVRGKTPMGIVARHDLLSLMVNRLPTVTL